MYKILHRLDQNSRYLLMNDSLAYILKFRTALRGGEEFGEREFQYQYYAITPLGSNVIVIN